MVAPENVNALYALSVQYARNNEPEKALQQVNKALNKQKENIQLLNLRASIHFAMKNYKAAGVDYEFIVKKNPKKADSWYNLGLCYYNLQNPRYKQYLLKARSLGFNVPKNLL